MTKSWLLCVVFCLLGLVAPQAAGADGTEFFVHARTPNYTLTPDGIAVAGYAFGQRPGAPALPLYASMVELPRAGEWTLVIMTRESRLLPQRVRVRPAPTPAPNASPGDEDVRTIEVEDPAIYARDSFYPQSVAVAGVEQWQRGKRLLPIQIYPFQYNPVTRTVLYHPDITVIVRVTPVMQVQATLPRAGEMQAAPAKQLRADESGALLLRVGQRGMHRLTYNDLSNAGVPVATVNPDTFQVTYLGEPVRIQVTGSADGRFDPSTGTDDPGDLVIFYAEPYVGRWMASNVYRFSYGTDLAGLSTRMAARTVTPAGTEPVVTSGKQTLRIEANKAYYYDFDISTEADHIFDDPIYPTSSEPVVVWPYDIILDDPVSSGDMTIQAQLYGGLDVPGMAPDQWAKIKVNQHDVGAYVWDGRTGYAVAPVAVPMAWLDQPLNRLNFVGDLSFLPGLSSYYYYVDWADITYPATLDAEGDRIEIQAPGIGGPAVRVKVTGFSTSAVRVYDVSDPCSPVQLLTTASESTGGATTISFWDDSAGLQSAYSLTTLGALLAPLAIEVDMSSAWRSPDNHADYIAIVHRSLWQAVQPLIDRRIGQGLEVAKVDVQDIYDEFNYGRLHQDAIRDFLKYAYENWNAGGPRPRYVVLIGDATPDYKQQLTNVTLPNLVPAFLANVDPFIIETAADNRFVTFDGPDDVLPEMTVGRIPARDAIELANYVNKVADYESGDKTPVGPWQERVVFVADDDENMAGNFNAMSDAAAGLLPLQYVPVKVYYNPDNDPPGGFRTAVAMEANIKAAFDGGAILLQWFGHASRFRWGGDYKMWDIYSVPGLSENSSLPFVAGFSCWDGYFISIHNNLQVLAERHLLQAGRGSIAGLSPSGKHIGSALSILDNGLTKSIFQERRAIIGDAVDAAKQHYYMNSLDPTTGKPVFGDVIDTSILFGDPVLQLRLGGPVSTPDAPYVYIQPNGTTKVDLLWDHVGDDASYYEVYRSTEPYPVIGAGPTNRIMDIPAGSAYGSGYRFQKTDAGTDLYGDDGILAPVQVMGDRAVNYFWLVQSRSSSGGGSGVLNTVGEFDFALVHGS